MSQCVPRWDLEDDEHHPKHSLGSAHSNSTHHHHDQLPPPMTEYYELAELTWENGQLGMHGFGASSTTTTTNNNNNINNPIPKPPQPSTWSYKPQPPTGTLESLVNQATRLADHEDDLVPWLIRQNHHRSTSSATVTMTMDALVPCSNVGKDDMGTCGSCTDVGASGADTTTTATTTTSATCTATATAGIGCAWTSFEASQDHDNTLTVDESNSVCHSTPRARKRETGDVEEKKIGNGKSLLSTKRSRAAAIHNQSERKRRDKINQRIKTLQKLVPNSSKTDKSSMLDEVIDYLKQLQAQVQMMSRMNMQPALMLPVTMQQQLQLSMMAFPMSMGSMGMGMGTGVLDINSMDRSNLSISPPLLHPSVFMRMPTWDASFAADRLSAASTASAVVPDPFSIFLASQPMTMDAHSRMAAMYQQLHQPLPSTSKS